MPISILAVVALTAPGAHAEIWSSDLGAMLTRATRIEIVKVTTAKAQRGGTAVDGKVVEAIRDAKVGDVAHVVVRQTTTPKAGDELLVICDSSMCPRVVGVAHDGWFSLTAYELDDAAMIAPNLVERSSLALLADNKAAPALCVTGNIALLDDARSPVTLKVDAATASATGTVDGRPVTGRLDSPLHADAASVTVELSGKGKALQLIADSLSRTAKGCYEATFRPARPLVRTRAAIGRMLDGKTAASVFARGSIVVAAGAPVAAGRHDFELSVDAAGALQLKSDLATGTWRQYETTGGKLAFVFPSSSAEVPALRIDLGPGSMLNVDEGTAAAVATSQAKSATLTWRWKSQGQIVETPLGTATISYVHAR